MNAEEDQIKKAAGIVRRESPRRIVVSARWFSDHIQIQLKAHVSKETIYFCVYNCYQLNSCSCTCFTEQCCTSSAEISVIEGSKKSCDCVPQHLRVVRHIQFKSCLCVNAVMELCVSVHESEKTKKLTSLSSVVNINQLNYLRFSRLYSRKTISDQKNDKFSPVHSSRSLLGGDAETPSNGRWKWLVLIKEQICSINFYNEYSCNPIYYCLNWQHNFLVRNFTVR